MTLASRGFMMAVTNAPPEPYSSLNALRQANDELLGSQPEDESLWGEAERRAAEVRTMEFVARAVETGAVLDMPADRKAAQGLINYWAARPTPHRPIAARHGQC